MQDGQDPAGQTRCLTHQSRPRPLPPSPRRDQKATRPPHSRPPHFRPPHSRPAHSPHPLLLQAIRRPSQNLTRPPSARQTRLHLQEQAQDQAYLTRSPKAIIRSGLGLRCQHCRMPQSVLAQDQKDLQWVPNHPPRKGTVGLQLVLLLLLRQNIPQGRRDLRPTPTSTEGQPLNHDLLRC